MSTTTISKYGARTPTGPLIDFDAIGANLSPHGRCEYPNINEWKTIYDQVQTQLIGLSITPGTLPVGFQNKLDTLLESVNTLYSEGDIRLGVINKTYSMPNMGGVEIKKTVHKTIIANINTAVKNLITDIETRGNATNNEADATTIISALQPLLIRNRIV